jgi:hypothetical protein
MTLRFVKGLLFICTEHNALLGESDHALASGGPLLRES